MKTATTRKTSIESKHLPDCDYFVIIPSRSHSTMLARYAKARLVQKCAAKLNIGK